MTTLARLALPCIELELFLVFGRPMKTEKQIRKNLFSESWSLAMSGSEVSLRLKEAYPAPLNFLTRLRFWPVGPVFLSSA